MNKYGSDSDGGSMLMVMLAVMMVIRIVVLVFYDRIVNESV